jgi:PAS domain S-box-containing protein
MVEGRKGRCIQSERLCPDARFSFLQKISGSLSDSWQPALRRARIAMLDGGSVDRGMARTSLAASEIQIDDVDNLVLTARVVQHLPFVNEAIAAWAVGDAILARLNDVATELRERHQRGELTPELVDQCQQQILKINSDVAPLAQEFADAMGRSFRVFTFALMLFDVVAFVCLLLMVMVYVNLSTRKQMRIKDALRETEARARVPLESISEAVLMVDVSGHVGYMNAAAQEMIDVKNRSYVGHSVDRIITLAHTDTSPVSSITDELFDAGRTATESEYLLRKDDGTKMYVHASASSIMTGALDDRMVGYVLVLKDMTRERVHQQSCVASCTRCVDRTGQSTGV